MIRRPAAKGGQAVASSIDYPTGTGRGRPNGQESQDLENSAINRLWLAARDAVRARNTGKFVVDQVKKGEIVEKRASLAAP